MSKRGADDDGDAAAAGDKDRRDTSTSSSSRRSKKSRRSRADDGSSSSSSSSSSDSGESSSSSSESSDDEEKSSKKKSSKKASKKSSSSSSKSSKDKHKKDKRKKDKDKKKDKKKHKSHKRESSSKAAAAPSKPIDKKDITPLTADDYFERNRELRLWLVEDRNQYFDDLTAADTRKAFAKFVDKWNNGELPRKYYDGVDMHAASDPSTRTRYKWGFASKLDTVELDSLRDSVDDMTESKSALGKEAAASAPAKRVIGPTMPSGNNSGDDIGPRPSQRADSDDEDRQRIASMLEQKRAKKAELERVESMMDEVAPRETGREAMLMKKRERSAYTRFERDEAPAMKDSDLMGGGDDFQSRLRAEKMREQRRLDAAQRRKDDKQASLADKVTEYRSKEDQTLAMFREMAKHHKLGGAGGGGGN